MKSFHPLDFLSKLSYIQITLIQGIDVVLSLMMQIEKSIKFIYHYLFYNMYKPNGEQSYMMGKDRRESITDMYQYPYDNLLFLYLHKKKIGTAFLIDEYHALTAAHNIYSQSRVFKQAFIFQYGKLGQISIRDSTLNRSTNKVVGCRCPEQFIKFKYPNPNKKLYDYAILRLDQPIYRQKYSSLLFDHQFDLSKDKVEVAGYPGQFFNYKVKEDTKKLQAFTHTDRLNKQKDSLLFYNVDTSAGQSGSPVYYRHNNSKYVVGIHIFGNDTNQGNQGIRLAEDHRKNIINWMKELYVPKLSMYHLDKNGLKDLSKDFSTNLGEEALTISWHEKNAISMDATSINNTNKIAWQFPLLAQKYTDINNETVTNKSDIFSEELGIFAVTYMQIQPIQVQRYKATINNITDKIVIGLITQKNKSRFIEEKGPISGFKDYLLAYMSIQDKLLRGGRIYYNGAIYPNYKTTDQSLFTQKGDQIEFAADFTYKRISLSINGNEKLIQLIPKQLLHQSFYIYVFLGRGEDSVHIFKLGEDTQGF